MRFFPQASRLYDFDSGNAILLEDRALYITNNYIAGHASIVGIETRTRYKVVGNKKCGKQSIKKHKKDNDQRLYEVRTSNSKKSKSDVVPFIFSTSHFNNSTLIMNIYSKYKVAIMTITYSY